LGIGRHGPGVGAGAGVTSVVGGAEISFGAVGPPPPHPTRIPMPIRQIARRTFMAPSFVGGVLAMSARFSLRMEIPAMEVLGFPWRFCGVFQVSQKESKVFSWCDPAELAEDLR
jgi:hypothetical protein